MSKRFDNKRLLYILAGLVVILVLTVVVKIPRERGTLKGKILEIDTVQVGKIILTPRDGDGKDIEFFQSSGKWMVKHGDVTAEAQKGSVQNMFVELISLKPQRLAAADKSKWQEYELTDSMATRIKVFSQKGKKLADLMIGKFSFNPSSNPYGGYGGYGGGSGTSFVRIAGEKEIYAVDGFLSFSFNREFDEWRDKTFIRFDKKDITKVSFTYPADSSFMLEKKDTIWYAKNMVADSLNTMNYLNDIGWLSGQSFRDGYKPSSDPVYQVQIEGNNLISISVKCYREGSDDFVLNSSLNPDIYFSSKRSEMVDQLFKPLSHFLKQVKKK